MPCERAFEEGDFGRREVEKLVDDGIDLAFGLFDFRRQAADLFAFLAKKIFPFVALFQRNFGLERFVDFGPEGFEVELPPFAQAVGEFWRAIRRAEVGDAAEDSIESNRSLAHADAD